MSLGPGPAEDSCTHLYHPPGAWTSVPPWAGPVLDPKRPWHRNAPRMSMFLNGHRKHGRGHFFTKVFLERSFKKPSHGFPWWFSS